MSDITPVTIEDKMKDSYLSYSLSVIVSRALPDVRDGLKPVHRRILYASNELGLTHKKSHKKSARIVGEVLGKYHPHGDNAVYNAMVRMAQPFNLHYPLIDGHGNFGSIDGDSAAAMRYTEARLTELSADILEDIEKNTVDFTDNFDGSLKEPVVLPSKVPNLLVNGASGIAVGMSTDIPPHNMTEVIDALLHMSQHPNARLETVMDKIQGPDFPTGAKIIGSEGIKEAYKTGKGKITLRAKSKIEKSGRTKQIIITELPYQTNKAKLIEEIANLVKKEKISNISDIRDESDQDGLRIAIDLKRGAESELVLNRLFKYSSLQKSHRINLLALHKNRPVVMSLKEMLNHFLDFRREVISKRTKYLLKKAEDRYHIVEGLIKAIDKLDLVISIIRNSESTSEAKNKLIEKLAISKEQAKAILEMRLQRLVGMETEKLKSEAKNLEEKINRYNKILNKEDVLDKLLRKELKEIKEKYGDKRKTKIIDNEDKAIIDKKDLIKIKNAVISLSHRNKIKRTDSYENIRASKNDYITKIVEGKTFDNLLFFTDVGQVYTLEAHELPEHHGLSTGENLKKYIKIPLKENIVGFTCINEKNSNKYITLATQKGMIKKTKIKEYETNYTKIKAIKLNSNDKVVSMELINDESNIIMANSNGKVIRFHANSFSETGRNTKGSRGMKLENNDYILNMSKTDDKNYIIPVTKSGKGHRSHKEHFKPQNRNGKGLNIAAASNYSIHSVVLANENDNLLITTIEEKMHKIPVSKITEVERPGYMYKLIDLDKNDKIKEVKVIPELNNL
ncbi:MAG: DNA gyrase subunit A [Bacillota bacterium]